MTEASNPIEGALQRPCIEIDIDSETDFDIRFSCALRGSYQENFETLCPKHKTVTKIRPKSKNL